MCSLDSQCSPGLTCDATICGGTCVIKAVDGDTAENDADLTPVTPVHKGQFRWLLGDGRGPTCSGCWRLSGSAWLCVVARC